MIDTTASSHSKRTVRVREVKALGEIHHLKETLVPQLGNLSVGETQSDTALAAVPHGKQDGRGIEVLDAVRGILGGFQRDNLRVLW